jgi:hypothetical protein
MKQNICLYDMYVCTYISVCVCVYCVYIHVTLDRQDMMLLEMLFVSQYDSCLNANT